MQFLSFFDEFPNLVNSEIRNIFVTDNHTFQFIPPGNYAFLEMFCPEIDCDCRKAIIPVVSANPNKTWAVLNYAWEPESFYKTWWGKQKLLYRPMSGVHFDPPTNDPLKQEFLRFFQNMIHTDKNYAKRIETHYMMFKKAMERKRT